MTVARCFRQDKETVMSYENATATKLLATNCVCCGRPLVDAVSVELGIGPECRKGYDAGMGDEDRSKANDLVHAAAVLAQKGHVEKVIECAEELKKLGFNKLGSKVGRRFKLVADKRLKADIVIQDAGDGMLKVKTPFRRGKCKDFIQAWRKIPGRRYSNGWNYIPVPQKPALWQLLVDYFPGKYGDGPKGLFRVPPAREKEKQLEMDMDDGNDAEAKLVEMERDGEV